MTKIQRSKQAEEIINGKLNNFFGESQLDLLDDLGIEILSDQFSNSELRDLSSGSDILIKSFVDKKQGGEVRRRLTMIHPEELEMMMPWYKQNCSEIEEVVDPQSGLVIALEVKHNTLNNRPSVHWDGRFIVGIGDRLLATRNRLDGVVGYQSGVSVEDPKFKASKKKFDSEMKKFKEARNAFRRDMEQFQIEEAKAEADPKFKRTIKKKPVEPGEKPVKPKQFTDPTDSRWSEVEFELIPEYHIMSSLSSSDTMLVKKHIKEAGLSKPVEKIKDGYKVDKFILRKVQI